MQIENPNQVEQPTVIEEEDESVVNDPQYPWEDNPYVQYPINPEEEGDDDDDQELDPNEWRFG